MGGPGLTNSCPIGLKKTSVEILSVPQTVELFSSSEGYKQSACRKQFRFRRKQFVLTFNGSFN